METTSDHEGAGHVPTNDRRARFCRHQGAGPGTPEFSAQYGLTLHIDAIDPSYTLGDLEAKKRQIREQLKAEGIFERNRQLPAPWDHRFLLVVSPPRAAGLGDFARDADRLQRHSLCQAVYAHSRFEGDGAATSIRDLIV